MTILKINLTPMEDAERRDFLTQIDNLAFKYTIGEGDVLNLIDPETEPESLELKRLIREYRLHPKTEHLPVDEDAD